MPPATRARQHQRAHHPGKGQAYRVAGSESLGCRQARADPAAAATQAAVDLHDEKREGRGVAPADQQVGEDPGGQEGEHESEDPADVAQAVGRGEATQPEDRRRHHAGEEERCAPPHEKHAEDPPALAGGSPRAFGEGAPRRDILEEHHRQRQAPGDEPRHQDRRQSDHQDQNQSHCRQEGRRLLLEVVVDVEVAQETEVDQAQAQQERSGEEQRPRDHPDGESDDRPRTPEREAHGLPGVDPHSRRRADADRHQAGQLERDDGDGKRRDADQQEESHGAQEKEEDVHVRENRASGRGDPRLEGKPDERRQHRERQQLEDQIGREELSPDPLAVGPGCREVSPGAG